MAVSQARTLSIKYELVRTVERCVCDGGIPYAPVDSQCTPSRLAELDLAGNGRGLDPHEEAEPRARDVTF